MTKQELLFYAAKAHGGLIYIEDMGWIHEDENGNRGAWWNPLDDSKDAFDLQVELGLVVSVNFDFTSVGGWSDAGDMLDVDHFDDKHAATRLAIVMAAAEIGKKMQNNCDLSDAAMERARYAMDKVKYSTDKVNQINLAVHELPEVAVMVGISQPKLLK